MKKKCIPLTLALLMSFSQAVPAFASPVTGEWLKGWTGKAGSTDYTVSENGDSFVLSNDKVNNGKFTDGEDSIIYAAQKISGEEDFTFSATVSIDEYSLGEESSNPQQGSVGIAVLDDVFNKTDDIAYTNSVFLGSYAPDKKSDMAIYPIIRDNSDKKSVGDALSDTFKNTGEDLGEFELSITKSGNMYTFACGENKYSAEVYSFDGDIYPALYIARNAKASFKNVKLDIADKRPEKVTVKEAETVYFYGQALKPVTAVISYTDGSQAETSEVSVKGYKPEKLGKQKLIVSAGAAKTVLDVTVKPRVTTDIEVDYAPVKTVYPQNGVFSTQGMQVRAKYNDGSEEILDDDDYTVKFAGKTFKDGDILPKAGVYTATVERKSEKGCEKGKAVDRFKIEVSAKTVTKLDVVPPAKTKYYIGDELDLAGMLVTAHYSDGTSEILEKGEYKVSGFDSRFAEKKLKITVSPVSGGAEASFDISVQQRSAVKLALTKYPRTVYAVGDDIDTGLSAAIEYDNGETEPTNAFSVDTSNIDTSEAGEYATGLATLLSKGTGAKTFATVVGMESDIKTPNDEENVAFVTNRKVFGDLRQISKDVGSGQFIAVRERGAKYIDDIPAFLTTDIAANQIFLGDWSQLLLALWGTLDISLNPYVADDRGALIITALQDFDIGVRHAESFKFVEFTNA